ncbi:hypothetical protein [Flavihumibacter petaseus]|uniref:Uncharacterized protein n=1 Tax=Flavihumibacter petaseus NBRC 106054 TaxID=1220578 RepID=A0A0E9N1R0_9BACT|nr:hypothetical protein [Flavihumibacter petaseus]GAO43789.1 hypothetical protein FPE01S_02_08950 [Flavihumibacter petaseus NBRC 106054]
MHKAKILAQLKAKHPGVSAAVLELVADKLAQTVTEEAKIDEAITALDNMPISIKDFADTLQKEGDRRVTEAQKKFKEKKAEPKEEDTPPGDNSDSALAKQLKALTDKLDRLEGERLQSDYGQRLARKLTDAKIPAQLAKGRTVTSDDELETVFKEIETDYADMKQTMANQGFGEVPKPGEGQKTEPTKTAVEAGIKDWAARNQPAKEAPVAK